MKYNNVRAILVARGRHLPDNGETPISAPPSRISSSGAMLPVLASFHAIAARDPDLEAEQEHFWRVFFPDFDPNDPRRYLAFIDLST